jgi:phenylpyruvate tautomerase PptA (4-oxalocrotonate tautomerase family)
VILQKEGEAMPHAVVKLMAGKSENQKIRRAKEQKSKRSKEQKSQLAEEITKDLMSVLNYGEQSVSVA